MLIDTLEKIMCVCPSTIDVDKIFREDKVGCTRKNAITNSKIDASKLGVCNREFGDENVFCASIIDVNRCTLNKYH